jgi:hypothetical protein
MVAGLEHRGGCRVFVPVDPSRATFNDKELAPGVTFPHHEVARAIVSPAYAGGA